VEGLLQAEDVPAPRRLARPRVAGARHRQAPARGSGPAMASPVRGPRSSRSTSGPGGRFAPASTRPASRAAGVPRGR
jgi:hypothetical protein